MKKKKNWPFDYSKLNGKNNRSRVRHSTELEGKDWPVWIYKGEGKWYEVKEKESRVRDSAASFGYPVLPIACISSPLLELCR